MARHFLALVVAERLAQGLRHLAELDREGGQCRLGRGIGHKAQQHTGRVLRSTSTPTAD